METKSIGKSLSFYLLFAAEQYRIQIPILQRDYAHGRPSAKEIRENFLIALKTCLENDKKLNLDFVYGSVQGDKFIPLDGQQRLTTLFLLHWFLASKSGNLESFVEWMTDEADCKFTYETRVSSKDFCHQLASSDISDVKNKPSEFLRDQSWFFLHWLKDPTVKGMLNTLDSIADIFPSTQAAKFYSALVGHSQPITFEFIELKEFGLSDQLYIKMNARGIALTTFENLKANVEQLFERHDEENLTQWTKWFSGQVDGAWTDFFWNQRNKSRPDVDNMILNFLRVSLTNLYAMELEVVEEGLGQMVNKNEIFNYYTLQRWDLNNAPYMRHCFRYLEHLNAVFENQTQLDAINELLDFDGLFTSTIHYEISYPERILHCAVWDYLSTIRFDDKFIPWLRVIRNLVQNSRLDDLDEYNAAMNSMRELLKQPKSVSDYLLNFQGLSLQGFTRYQTQEEILKLMLFESFPQVKERICKFENHKYLQGQIGFLLDFSGMLILDENEKQTLCTKKEIEVAESLFDHYYQCFEACFDEEGIRPFNEFLFERALLCIGDYTLNKRSNKSFLINGNDRDISWKRFLRSDNSKYLKILFDKIDLDDVESSLLEIIKNNEIDKNDWRYFFIHHPQIIGECGRDKFIRHYNSNQILLLKKMQTNGMHKEYYSYAVLCELEKLGFEVEYQEACIEIDFEKFISKINGKSIKVYFGPSEDDFRYLVEYRNAERKKEEKDFKSHDEVIRFIKSIFPK